MNFKLLWLICGGIFLILIAALIFNFEPIKDAFQTNLSKIAGLSVKNTEPVNFALTRPPEKSSEAKDPQIYAKAVALYDLNSFFAMYEKNADTKVPIASTTKMMTAIVVLEDFSDHLDDTVTITAPMINVEGSDIQLRVGEKIKVRDLLKGLLIMSGNDTAYALANHFGGLESFVAKMNTKAATLGLQNTHFKDPAGLNDEGYSTAHELALIAVYAMRHQEFSEIVKTSETTVASVDGRFIHELKTSNRLIKSDEFYYMPYALGVKTGFTYAAGHCLVSAAEKDGHEIVGVILNTNESTITASAEESKKLLEWGFNNWTWN